MNATKEQWRLAEQALDALLRSLRKGTLAIDLENSDPKLRKAFERHATAEGYAPEVLAVTLLDVLARRRWKD
jgi:hypothetical protein